MDENTIFTETITIHVSMVRHYDGTSVPSKVRLENPSACSALNRSSEIILAA